MIPHTFIHEFAAKGLRVRLTFTMPRTGEVEIQPCEWSRDIAPHERAAVLQEYRTWRGMVLQQIADETGVTITLLTETAPGRWEPHECAPRERHDLLRTRVRVRGGDGGAFIAGNDCAFPRRV